jgi:hypothetical protein
VREVRKKEYYEALEDEAWQEDMRAGEEGGRPENRDVGEKEDGQRTGWQVRRTKVRGQGDRRGRRKISGQDGR